MKNKRIFVGLFVILALLFLSIGYAALVHTLRIGGGVETGTTENLNANFIIYFSKVDIDTTLAKGATVTAEVDASKKSLETTFSIKNMSIVGSKVVLTYTVNNDSVDLYANSPAIHFNGTQVNANEAITVEDISGADKYFRITVTPNMVNDLGVSGQAAPKSTHTITIVVEMIKTPLDQTSYDFELGFVYQATNLAYSG